MSAEANVGVVGLAAMGASLARNLARHGNSVAVYNRHYARTEHLIDAYGDEGEFHPAKTVEEFVASLEKPRTAIIMVKAGAATDAVIDELAEYMEPGDIIVDGGNSYFKDTIRREKELRAKGLHFVGMGVSGGEEGALLGPSMMPGGSDESWTRLKPILESIAAKAGDGEPCVMHVGENGAGHFVKMVHNGIEYADMQLIAESYDIMRRGLGMDPDEIGDVFEQWNSTDLDSYLIEITAEVLHKKDPQTGKPLVDVIFDHAGMKGTGTWTVQTALELGVPVTGIAEAVFARGLSDQTALREKAQDDSFAGPDGHIELGAETRGTFIERIRQALYASKIIAYAQGFNEIGRAAETYGWDIDMAHLARIWRAGCIIRAKFLDRISEAFKDGAADISLLFAPYFKQGIEASEPDWRHVVAAAAQVGLPAPVFSSSLAYFDGLRAKRLPAALIQGQRDLFGAHTYKRVDEPGSWHILWAEPDQRELKMSD
ncbi:NADP-dependent phosphogluconate dehydrogenase [uncultured Bifidobacterium sp.]|uniref:NADP-dependent phosphogluconate dehydrogenase n=1 Tax=uncultured Bifidobacterium sp. TaxID=165187 RepID=UPI0025838EE7|nr:NADP-dependent phosphogluconate dehydrogenase [uncultured Bifidobacterium sp.]MEE0653804.1 NADP-dependent phosphogluconate dehydrogenase [Bifidobacterium criceti]